MEYKSSPFNIFCDIFHNPQVYINSIIQNLHFKIPCEFTNLHQEVDQIQLEMQDRARDFRSKNLNMINSLEECQIGYAHVHALQLLIRNKFYYFDGHVIRAASEQVFYDVIRNEHRDELVDKILLCWKEINNK